MKPNKFDDIIALVALYRPGPMSNIPIYNDCKNGLKKPDYSDAFQSRLSKNWLTPFSDKLILEKLKEALDLFPYLPSIFLPMFQ